MIRKILLLLIFIIGCDGNKEHSTVQFNENGFSGYAIKQEKPEHLVFFIHAYDHNAYSVANFTNKYLAHCMPDASFYIPNAQNFSKRAKHFMQLQWWDLPNFEAVDLAKFSEQLNLSKKTVLIKMANDANKKAGELNRFVLRKMKEHRIEAKNVYIIGISQGAMTALEMVYQRNEFNENLGGIISFGGALLWPERIRRNGTTTKTPALLVHGTKDTLIPISTSNFATRFLRALGIKVRQVKFPARHEQIEFAGAETACEQLKKWSD